VPCEVQFWWAGNHIIVDPVERKIRGKAFKEILSGRASKLVIAPSEMPSDKLIARFLAKVSVEFIAARVISIAGWEAFLVDDSQLDPIRRFARRGDVPESWPFSIRKIYEEDAAHIHKDGLHQVLHEFDFLVTPQSEWYGVLCLFGIEMAINLGGPEIDGYQIWLKDNDGRSPLYLKEDLRTADPRSRVLGC
jgi:hypothetical protein